jgi:malonyl CoA-acyl carrier protein transacylase
MEMLWSGGEASPPIPLESYRRTAPIKPKHALLFPGSGSQYVGMGNFLRGFPAAQQVWLEANQALEGFEEWRKGLKLEERDGELGELGRMLIEREQERKDEKKLQEVVFEGPQVSSATPTSSLKWSAHEVALL